MRIRNKCLTGKFWHYLGVVVSYFTLLPCALADTGFSLTADTVVIRRPADEWEVVGNVTVALAKPNTLLTGPGTGIYAFFPDRKADRSPLQSTEIYADVELEFSYLLAAGSEAALYLHGIYPMTLSDDGNPLAPTVRSNGGIGGYPPRQSVGRSPGLWQHLKIVFSAPKSGEADTLARIVRAQLNGVTIHENIPLAAPASAAVVPAAAPFRIEVVRGAVAVRGIKARRLAELPKPANTGSANPILVTAEINRTHRSFMDIPGGSRVTHAISIGHPQQIHYTYDLEYGNLFQVWRGEFLDATPMWRGRGNGTSRPLGSVVRFGAPLPTIAKLGSLETVWPRDTAGSNYKPEGYRIDPSGLPAFHYRVYEGQVEDVIQPLPQGNGFSRTIRSSGMSKGTYIRLAASSRIAGQGKGIYLIGDNTWYLMLEEAGPAKPVIREGAEGSELLIPAAPVVRYSIIF